MTGDLHRYFLNNSHKRLHKLLHYFDIYERHFERFRNKPVVMLEIGVFGGGSLAMWKDYLGPQSKIIGLDINPDCKQHEADGIEVFIGSQDDPLILAKILEKYPEIDFVIDDGSHQMHHMIASFEYLYPKVSQNGVYLAEDTCCCYWEQFGGGLKKEYTFIEHAKNCIDAIQASANLVIGGNTEECISPTDMMRSTHSIAFYDSVVVFEKRPQGKRMDLITSPM
ncbi:MAG: CmcI family methyltransferase [Marinomonas sp.]